MATIKFDGWVWRDSSLTPVEIYRDYDRSPKQLSEDDWLTVWEGEDGDLMDDTNTKEDFFRDYGDSLFYWSVEDFKEGAPLTADDVWEYISA